MAGYMQASPKLFLFFIIFTACSRSKNAGDETMPRLFEKPLSYTLDTIGGYRVNPFTGDSVKPLTNEAGSVFRTGVPVKLITQKIGDDVLQPVLIRSVKEEKTILPGNIHHLSTKLTPVPVDTARLKKIKLGEGDPSVVIKNSFGIVPTGVAIPVTGKKMPFYEPRPVKASPLLVKDIASSSIQYLDVDQGLSYSYVYAVCDDNKGNLWFGLDGTGISKYDGKTITTYTFKEGLSNNIVTAVIEDSKHNLWIGTHGGVTMFDGKNFTRYTEKEGLPHNEIVSLMEDKKGNLWFSSIGGLTRFDGKYFTNYSSKEGLPGGAVFNCIEDRKGNIWVATQNGVASFDGNSFTHFTGKDGIKGEAITKILEDRYGNIWFGSVSDGITKFDGRNFTYINRENGFFNNTIRSMFEDSDGNIWIGSSGNGVFKFQGNSFTHYSVEQGLSNNKVRDITEDISGNIWLATEGGGINKINKTSFNYAVPEKVVDNNRIRPILKDRKGDLWFGTDYGYVGKLSTDKSRNQNVFTYYRIQDKQISPGQRSLLEDDKGNIWIGTTGSGLLKYDGKVFTQYSFGKTVERQSVYDMRRDRNGNIWLAARDGTILHYNGKEFISFNSPGGLPGRFFYSILEDSKGNIWFSTDGAGVYKYDGKGLIVYSAKEGLFSKGITSMAEDEAGNIWLGTLGNGVCRFDGKSFTYYTEKQGLSNDNVWSVFYDSSKQLWIGTDKGLTLCVQNKDSLQKIKDEYRFYIFRSADGLKAIDFNLHSAAVDDNNHLWWGTGKSVPSYDLNKNFRADSLRSLHLNYIEINEQFYDFRNLADSVKKHIDFSTVIPFYNYPGNLVLDHRYNHLTFHFSAIDWSAPDKIKYSYRLKGLDNNWSIPSESATADYRNLSYGNYTFQVRAIGRSQIWTEPFNYSFSILPAWWQTWWFKIIAFLLSAFTLFLIIRFVYLFRLRKQKAQLEKQLAVQLERQRISAEMHDDIGAGLSGVRLLTELTKNKIKEGEAAGDMEKIYQSVGDISSRMKEVIWSLNSENDHLDNLIHFLVKQVKAQLEHYPAELKINIPSAIPVIPVSGEARRNIYLAVKEAVNNIIKHSGASKVELEITCEDRLKILISDNGKGMDSAAAGETGNGLKNMRQRMKALGGTMETINNNGFTIQFHIPLSKEI